MPPQLAMQLRRDPSIAPSDPWRVLHWRVSKQGSLLPMLVGVVLLPAAAAWAPAASLSARPQAFAASRRAVLGEASDADVLVLPAHFPGPSAGRVVTAGDSWRFQFVTE